MNKVIIVVDLGHFKAYKVSKEPLESERVEMIESFDNVDAHGKMGDKVSDSAGKFGLGGGKNGIKGYGEPHNIGLETKRRAVKSLAQNINEVICREDCTRWYLAAGKKINNQLVNCLDPVVKAKLSKNISSDLTKVKKSEILTFFEIG